MYGEAVPPVLSALIAHLEEAGQQVEDLFGGDPRVRDLNDLIDELHAGGSGVDLYAVTRGDARLAAATLAAYTRNLPEPLLPSPEVDLMYSVPDEPDYARKIASLR